MPLSSHTTTGAGEDAARWLGHGELALGIGLDNPDARRLYEWLGYVERGPRDRRRAGRSSTATAGS